jgi:outer membrane receptor protein involved in Fe transport
MLSVFPLFSRFGARLDRRPCRRALGGWIGSLGSLLAGLTVAAPVFAAEDRPQMYRLPEGDAESTLALFIRQSGREIIYSPTAVSGVTTHAVRGEFAAREALARMVAGTVLSVRQDEKTGAFTVRRAPQPSSPPSAADVPVRTEAAPEPKAIASETVELDKFNVNYPARREYAAAQTMPGPRMDTPLRDLPFTVNVLTSEFFEDFAIFEFNDTLTQIGGLTGLSVGGPFNLRGFAGTAQLRDGFFRLGRNGPSSVDRIEVIKGPNAGIYGRTTPGGMINLVSKQPRAETAQKATLAFGDYGTRLGALEATGSAGQGTSYILTLSRLDRKYDVPGSTLRNDEAYLAVRHEFADGSRLQASAEYFLQLRQSPPGAAPVVIDAHGSGVGPGWAGTAVGYADNLAKVNWYGPNSELNRGENTFLASYERKLGTVWTLRTSGQYFRARRWDYNLNTGFNYEFALLLNHGGFFAGPSSLQAPITATRFWMPSKNFIAEDGGGFQGDLTAHYWFGRHAVENKTLLTVDFNDYYRYDPLWYWMNLNAELPPDLAAWKAAGPVVLNADYTPAGPVAYFPKPFEWGHESISRLTRRRTSVLGGVARHETHWLSDRLLTYAGARFDAVRFRESDKLIAAGAYAHREETQFRPNLGALYQVKPGWRVYANHSESYFVDQGTNPNFIANPEYRPETARGYDFGLKASLLDDRLNLTLGGYYIERFNVPIMDDNPAVVGLVLDGSTPPPPNQLDRSAGNQLDRGWEIDATWQASPEVSAALSFGHVNAIYTAYGTSAPTVRGRSVPNMSPENGSLSLRYAPVRGRLRQFSANVGVTYVSKTPTELPNAGDTGLFNPFVPNGRVYTYSTGQWNLKVPSYTLWNFGLHYRFGGPARLEHTLSLNVNNVFDHHYLRVSKLWGDGRAVYLTWRLESRAGVR